MKYGNKNILDMTDEELKNASFAFNDLFIIINEKRNNPKFLEKFKNQKLPPINSALSTLQDNINNEIMKRSKDKENAS